MIKKRIIFIGIVFSIITISSNYAQQFNPESDFLVEVINDSRAISIIDYIGIRKDVIIPPRIRNLPVTLIGFGSFQEKELTSVILPNGITSIESGAFNNNKLRNIIIPANVILIGFSAFANNQLESITIHNNSAVIRGRAFENNQLTNITIPNGITDIGNQAFSGNNVLSITIGSNIIVEDDMGWIGSGANRISIPSQRRKPFDNGFEIVYIIFGRIAGTYIRSDINSNIWRKQ